jgi:tetratricopeptide (TPR) repeat protein
MSFLSRIFEPAWKSSLRRATAALAAQRWAEAWREYQSAQSDAPSEESAGIDAGLDRAGAALVAMNLEVAAGAARAGDPRAAIEAVELAGGFARSPEDRERVAAQLEHLRASRHRAAVADAATEATPKLELVDFAMLLTSMPDELADRYDELPKALRHAICHARTLADAESAELLERAGAGVDSAIPGFERGVVLLGLGRDAEAAEVLFVSANRSDAWNDVRRAAAHALWNEERWADAEAVLQAAIDADHSDAGVWSDVVMHSVLTQEYAAGMEAVTEALRTFTSDIRLRTLHARLLELTGDPLKAITIYEDIIARTWRLDAESGSLTFHGDSAHLAALNYMRRGVRLERAEELLSALGQALEGELRERTELDRAWVWKRLGRTSEAADLLDRVVRGLDPKRVVAQAWAARIADNHDEVARLVAGFDDRARTTWSRLLRDRGLDG